MFLFHESFLLQYFVFLDLFCLFINIKESPSFFKCSCSPLIVYKDITYFPMTYHGARFLNVKANWYDSTKVLFVGKAEEKEDVLQLEKAASKNKSAYTATIRLHGCHPTPDGTFHCCKLQDHSYCQSYIPSQTHLLQTAM